MNARNFGLASIFVLVLACGRDEDTPPQNDTGTTTEDPTDPTDPTGTTTSGPDTMTSPSTTADTSGTGDEASTGEEECLGQDGCWSCDAQTPEQVLNHCTAAECEPFPNTQERLPLLEDDGTLPPIP